MRAGGRKIDAFQAMLEHLLLSRQEIDTLMRWRQLMPRLLSLQAGDPVARFHLYRLAQQDLYGLVLLASLWHEMCLLPAASPLTREDLQALWQEWGNRDSVVAHPPLLLDGRALMQGLNMRPGPLLGKLLLAIQEAQAAGRIVSAAEALDLARDLSQTWLSGTDDL